MRPRARYAPILGLLLLHPLFESCVQSQYPLSDPDEATADPRLAGLWKTAGSPNYYHVLPGEKGLLKVVHVGHGKQGDGGRTALFSAFVTRLDGKDYLNLRPVTRAGFFDGKEKLEKHYYIVKFELDGPDSARLWYMDAEFVGEAIREKRLKGQAVRDPFAPAPRKAAGAKEPGGNRQSWRLQEPGPRLAEFLRSADSQRLFARYQDLERIGAPEGEDAAPEAGSGGGFHCVDEGGHRRISRGAGGSPGVTIERSPSLRHADPELARRAVAEDREDSMRGWRTNATAVHSELLPNGAEAFYFVGISAKGDAGLVRGRLLVGADLYQFFGHAIAPHGPAERAAVAPWLEAFGSLGPAGGCPEGPPDGQPPDGEAPESGDDE